MIDRSSTRFRSMHLHGHTTAGGCSIGGRRRVAAKPIIPSSGSCEAACLCGAEKEKQRGRRGSSVAWRWCETPPSNKSRSLSSVTQTVTEKPKRAGEPPESSFWVSFRSGRFCQKVVSCRNETSCSSGEFDRQRHRVRNSIERKRAT